MVLLSCFYLSTLSDSTTPTWGCENLITLRGLILMKCALLVWIVLLVPCSLIRSRKQSEYCLPKQRENNTKQRVKYISVCRAGALTSTLALPESSSAPLFTKAQASWKHKTESRNRFSSANTCSSALLSTTLFSLHRGMTQTIESPSPACPCSSSSAWRTPS